MRGAYGLILHLVVIYVSLLSFGYFQEKISVKSYGNQQFKYYAFLSLLQGVGGALTGFVALKKSRMQTVAGPWLLLDYFKCSAIRLLSVQLGHKASENIDYPTLVVARSCKIIPILAMNFLLYGRKYEARKYISAVFLTVGILFFLSRSNEASSHRASGKTNSVLLLFLSMICDGSVNSIQDNIFKLHSTGPFHMMLYLNMFSVLMSLAITVLSKELLHALAFLKENPSVLLDLLCLSTLNVLGQVCVYSMLEKYGAFTLTISTVSRKILSVFVSVAVFKHRMCKMQCVGLLLVFFSFSIEILCAQGKRLATK